MKAGDYFEKSGRVFKITSLHYYESGRLGVLVAECLTPDSKDSGEWWNFRIDEAADLPDIQTLH